MKCSNTDKWLSAACILGVAATLTAVEQAYAYPEFQAFAEKNSKRTVNCAMCHASPDGPVGDGPGQLGSLDEEAMKRLTKARQANEPGAVVDNPLLNKFGNQIIQSLGRKEFIKLKSTPEQLGSRLDKKNDLDNDGLSDAEEYMDGTSPLNHLHGDPWKLFKINFDRHKVDIALAVISVALLNYGIVHWLKGIEALRAARREESES